MRKLMGNDLGEIMMREGSGDNANLIDLGSPVKESKVLEKGSSDIFDFNDPDGTTDTQSEKKFGMDDSLTP